jgi:hypothetical protein
MNAQTGKMAAEMVAQQIALYDQEIVRIEEQISNMEARKAAVQMMRTALLGIVKETPAPAAPPAGKAGTGTKGTGNGAGASAAPVPNDVAKTVHHPNTTGFAAAVRSILRGVPKGLRPSEVAEAMKANGSAASYTGKVPLVGRVNSELYRLMKNGEFGRRAGRYYVITQEQPQ